MLTILALVGVAFGGGVCLMVREIRRAPSGFQDENGFHLTRIEDAAPVAPAVDHARAA